MTDALRSSVVGGVPDRSRRDVLVQPQGGNNGGELNGDSLPEDFLVSAVIVVCDEVADSPDATPVNLGARLPEGVGQAVGSGREVDDK